MRLLHRAVGTIAVTLAMLAVFAGQSATGNPPPTACDRALANLAKRPKADLARREFAGPAGESAEGSSLYAYYRADGGVAFIELVFYGETGRRDVDYALLDRASFDYTVTDTRYRQPLSADPSGTVASSDTRRYRVCEGERVALTVNASAEARRQDGEFADRLGELLARVEAP